jgi:hypothetical protein
LLFAYAPEVRKQFGVNLTPYAFIVRKDGVVISKGLVNQMEHLESLLEIRGKISDLEGSGIAGELAAAEKRRE